MPETETKIKVTADGRGLKTLERGMRDAFSPLTVRQFREHSRGLERDLQKLTGRQLELTRAMQDVKRGTDAYKKLREELDGIKDQADAVVGSMGALNKAYGEFDRAAQRRRSFIGGVAQGAGLGQFIPAEPGMGGRMAGMMAGGALRRGLGAAAMPFQMPGLGGLSAAMAAIPGFGPLAAGGLQTAAGLYQQHVAFQRAMLPNLYWAGGPTAFGRAARTRGVQPEPSAMALEGQRQAVQDVLDEGHDRRLRQLRAEQALLETGQGTRGARQRIAQRRAAAMRTANLNVGLFGMGAAPAAADVEDAVRRGLTAELSAATQQSEAGRDRIRRAKEEVAVSRENGRWRAFLQAAGGLGPGRRMFDPAMGAGFGFDPSQALGMVGQFMGARGGVASAQAETQAREMLAAQVAFGVGPGAAGQFARMAMGGGGGRNMGAGLAGVLESAVRQGLRGSQVNEYLGTLVQLGQEAEKRGVKLNVQEFTRQTALLGQLGMGELQRGRQAAGFAQAARQIAETGVQTPQQLLLLRAAGFDPKGGRASFVRAVDRIEEGRDMAEVMGNIIFMAAQQTRGFGGAPGDTPEEIQTIRAYHFRRALQKHAIRMEPGMATQKLNSILTTHDPEGYRRYLAWMAEREGLAGQEQAGRARAALGLGARLMAGGGAPSAVAAAGLQVERIQAGGRMGETFIRLERVGMETAKIVGNFNSQILTVVTGMEKMASGLRSITEGNLLDNLRDLLKGALLEKSKGRRKVGGK